MESTTLTKSLFISSRRLLIILVLHFLLSGRLSGAATPYIGNSTSSTTTASGSIDVEFEAGAVVLSTWESASTHRILAQTQINVASSTKKTAACDSTKYAKCISDTASGAAARPCLKDYTRCSRNSS